MRRPALTADLVARVERTEPDPGPAPDLIPLGDACYGEAARDFLARHPGGPVHVFAYGSLIWNPEFEHEAELPATAHGWRRAFCLHLYRWRGTPDRPGLMLALARGGSCRGVVLRLPASDIEARMEAVLRRETESRQGLALTRWIPVHTAAGRIPALAFYCAPRPDGVRFLDLPIAEQARRIAHAAGHIGCNAAYLRNTLVHLEARGIHDRYLWKLQALVAREIEAGGSAPPVSPGSPAPDR